MDEVNQILISCPACGELKTPSDFGRKVTGHGRRPRCLPCFLTGAMTHPKPDTGNTYYRPVPAASDTAMAAMAKELGRVVKRRVECRDCQAPVWANLLCGVRKSKVFCDACLRVRVQAQLDARRKP